MELLGEATLPFSFWPTFSIGVNSKKKEILLFKSRPSFCKGFLSREAYKMSQKFFPFCKILEKDGGVFCVCIKIKTMQIFLSFSEIILLLLESRDPPTLVESTRLIYSSISNTGTRGTWINAIQRSEEVLGHLLFIFQSSTNCKEIIFVLNSKICCVVMLQKVIIIILSLLYMFAKTQTLALCKALTNEDICYKIVLPWYVCL